MSPFASNVRQFPTPKNRRNEQIYDNKNQITDLTHTTIGTLAENATHFEIVDTNLPWIVRRSDDLLNSVTKIVTNSVEIVCKMKTIARESERESVTSGAAA
jgi:hypothetical protein